jgi:hypothetical protein
MGGPLEAAAAALLFDGGHKALCPPSRRAWVYLTPDKDVAVAVARHRGLQFAVECEVMMGMTYDFDEGCVNLSARSTAWSRRGYNSAQSMHPPWAGARVAFREVCVHDPANVRPIHVEGYVAAPT